MTDRTVSLTVELPFRTAECLADHGEELIAALRVLVANAKAEALHERRAQAADERAEQLANRARELDRIGRAAYRRFRQLLALTPYARAGVGNQQAFRAQAVRSLAPEFGVEVGALDFIIQRFRNDLTKRIRARRRHWIIRYWREGRPIREIGGLVGVSKPTVEAAVQRFKKAAALVGVPVAEMPLPAYRRDHAPKVAIGIRWSQIQSIRERA